MYPPVIQHLESSLLENIAAVKYFKFFTSSWFHESNASTLYQYQFKNNWWVFVSSHLSILFLKIQLPDTVRLVFFYMRVPAAVVCSHKFQIHVPSVLELCIPHWNPSFCFHKIETIFVCPLNKCFCLCVCTTYSIRFPHCVMHGWILMTGGYWLMIGTYMIYIQTRKCLIFVIVAKICILLSHQFCIAIIKNPSYIVAKLLLIPLLTMKLSQ